MHAALITSGECKVVLMSAGGARLHVGRSHTAPWTRPANELVVGYGLFTAAEFALMARRHMITYGTTPEQLATAAATIRNNGHDNPDAVYCGRGPVHAGRHPGVTDGRRPLPSARLRDDLGRWLRDRAHLGRLGPWTAANPYLDPRRRNRLLRARLHRCPCVGLQAATGRQTLPGRSAARAARISFPDAPVSRPDDVDVAELYDPFSFEIIRQLEAFGFCDPGEGGAFVDGREHRTRRPPPRHHRRGNDELQPRRASPPNSSSG